MPPELDPPAGRADAEYWQSVDQWMDSDKFRGLMRDEFPDDAGEWLDPVSRRKFLGLMGASAALAGAVGCNPSVRPASQRKVVPYVTQPDQIVPGVPLFFATAMPQLGGVGLGLMVRSHEGRPVKVEGNPNHPDSLGGSNVYAQASVLGLYDPDRSKEVTHRGTGSTLDKALEAIRNELSGEAGKPDAQRGAGVRILSETVTSPTLIRQVEEFLRRFPAARWVQYEPLARDNARKAAQAAFGKPVNVVHRFDRAKVVLSLDCDFLAASTPADVRNARQFMAGRKVRVQDAGLAAKDGVKPEDMSRLYAVEAMLTSTGAVADHRLPLKPSQVEAFARAVAAKLGVAGAQAPADLPESAKRWVDPVAEDLNQPANRGRALVVVGDTQPPVVHLLAHAINEKLGANGQTVLFTDPLESAKPASDQTAALRDLVGEMNGGRVGLLMVLGGNPVFDAPADLEFGQALDKMKGTTVHFGLYGPTTDETAAHCHWHINAAHYLETWGDVKGSDGAVAVQQPLIAPLFGGKAAIELFATLLELTISDPLELVRATWQPTFDKLPDAQKAAGFDPWWQRAVRDGVVPGTGVQANAAPGTGGTVTVSAIQADRLNDPALATPPAAKGGKLEIQFRQDLGLLDGRFANNGWLQELPRPITNLTWDNAAIMSPRTAAELGCATDFAWTAGERGRAEVDVVTLQLGGRKINAAVWILPGHADDCVTLHVGSGRKRSGRVGMPNGASTGFNAYELRTTGAMWSAAGLEVTKTRDKYYLACTQGQYAMEDRRPVRHATVEQFAKDRDFAQIPPATAGEYKDIRELTPGTPEDFERLGLHHPFGHAAEHHHHDPVTEQGHTADEKKGEKETGAHSDEHDSRLIPLSLYPKYPQKVQGEEASKGYRRWGMAIDLNACTGCTTCVVACVAENNTPVVGKEQVTKGRAMHWLRIDRYFSIPGEHTMEDKLGGRDTAKNFLRGNAERAERVKDSAAIRTHLQPMMCVQCEKAPCEVVCPVGATVHDAQGLNVMVYNRCVGTRYCSNNCPYKVRRFNFLQYADYHTESLKLLNNPEVTVRQRGVMEKCTYCIQRIQNADIEAEREWQTRPKDRNGRPKIKDGEVMTACQSACPTGAIMFGDLGDFDPSGHTGSAVLRWKAEPHSYGVLAELNTMPRTSWLAQIRNPNPKMPQGA